MSAVDGLERPCQVCGRVSGDHTMREWAVCMGTTTMDLPFEQIPEGDAAATLIAASLRERFGLDPDTIIADHVVIRAVTLSGKFGQLDITLPALFHEFQVGVTGVPPTTVAKVVYVGDVGAMRAYGRLARDSANGAANRAEGR